MPEVLYLKGFPAFSDRFDFVVCVAYLDNFLNFFRNSVGLYIFLSKARLL